MEAQEAIRKVKAFGLHHAIGDLPYSCMTVEAFEMAIKALEEQEKNRWRNVEDEIPDVPEDSGTVRVIGCKESGRVMLYDFTMWDDVCGGFYPVRSNGESRKMWDDDVVAWKPLPNPYKGE